MFAETAKPWRQMSDDDRYVRNALRKTNRYDGDVFVKNVSIAKLSTYGPLINDLHVNQSPAIVVIDANLKGRVLTGYVDRISINQVIADAHDASVEPDIKDAYLRRFNDTCGRFNLRAERWSCPTWAARRPTAASLDRALAHRPQLPPCDRPHDGAGQVACDARRLDQGDGRRPRASCWPRRRPSSRAAPPISWSRSILLAKRNASVTALDRRFNAAGVTGCQLNRRS